MFSMAEGRKYMMVTMCEERETFLKKNQENLIFNVI